MHRHETARPERIFLIGPRGAGKTRLGAALARELGFSFTDTDDLVQAGAGMDVAGIVAAEGWEGFRRRETAALRSAARPRSVTATGGGMVLDAANRAFMREQGLALYLRAPLAVLQERLRAALNPGLRPSLTGEDPVAELARVVAEREPLYRETGHVMLDAALAPEALLREALAAVAVFLEG